MPTTTDRQAEAIGELTETHLAIAAIIAGGVQTRAGVLERMLMTEDELSLALITLWQAGMLHENSNATVCYRGDLRVRPRLCLTIQGYRWTAPTRAATSPL